LIIEDTDKEKRFGTTVSSKDYGEVCEGEDVGGQDGVGLKEKFPIQISNCRSVSKKKETPWKEFNEIDKQTKEDMNNNHIGVHQMLLSQNIPYTQKNLQQTIPHNQSKSHIVTVVKGVNSSDRHSSERNSSSSCSIENPNINRISPSPMCNIDFGSMDKSEFKASFNSHSFITKSEQGSLLSSVFPSHCVSNGYNVHQNVRNSTSPTSLPSSTVHIPINHQEVTPVIFSSTTVSANAISPLPFSHSFSHGHKNSHASLKSLDNTSSQGTSSSSPRDSIMQTTQFPCIELDFTQECNSVSEDLRKNLRSSIQINYLKDGRGNSNNKINKFRKDDGKKYRGSSVDSAVDSLKSIMKNRTKRRSAEENEKQTKSIMMGHCGSITALFVLPATSFQLVTASNDGNIIVWDLETNKINPHAMYVYMYFKICFYSKYMLFHFGDRASKIRMFEDTLVSSSKIGSIFNYEIINVLSKHSFSVTSLLFHPTTKLLISGGMVICLIIITFFFMNIFFFLPFFWDFFFLFL
jgi:hypothetical protein